jgi:hypothetical protein
VFIAWSCQFSKKHCNPVAKNRQGGSLQILTATGCDGLRFGRTLPAGEFDHGWAGVNMDGIKTHKKMFQNTLIGLD